MSSFAHYSFGAVYGWMAHRIGGIDYRVAAPNAHLLQIGSVLTAPSYHAVWIMPQIDPKLTWAKTSYKCLFGTIATSWKREGDRLDLAVTIPANSKALVSLPVDARGITASDRPIGQAEGVRSFNPQGHPGEPILLDSGTYGFRMRLR